MGRGRTQPPQCQPPAALGDGGATLILIGDPKQAIYAFRGADVYAYLEAARSAGAQATLEVNWRSDQGLIDAYDAMFGGAKLGHEGIVYRRVWAADANQTPRLIGAPSPAPVRIRVVHRDQPSITLTAAASPATRARAMRPGSRRSSTAPAASSAPPRPASGCAYLRRSSGPPPPREHVPPRSPASSAGPVSASPAPRTRSGRTCIGACTTGRACCASRASRR
jgi:exodeoxyribonuclease V beta subunit